MGRALVGAVAAAVAMFVIGFIFFATPLQKIATSSLDDAQAAAVQQSLAANLPGTGTFYVPGADTRAQSEMYSRGPVATVHYNIHGFAVASSSVMIAGFVHMLIVALLMAAALYLLSRHVVRFADQARIFGLFVVATVAYLRFGEPIWFHQAWQYAIYMFVAECVSLGVAGFVILKLLPRTAARAIPAGATSDL
ncbi:MAG: hypothetical protein JWN69_1250 [Alphaproteobacteria bacterium]|nr:hypothetical protein [Alphaproteobacteria bacterium]